MLLWVGLLLAGLSLFGFVGYSHIRYGYYWAMRPDKLVVAVCLTAWAMYYVGLIKLVGTEHVNTTYIGIKILAFILTLGVLTSSNKVGRAIARVRNRREE
ncbi:MAG: hypothetical protein KGJ89_02970 [Patescibacteria group bacterium]|nr:hypothetical protein [Patescibacteria group bacterium]MDE2015488.1 hypothetical protein [Patescibacteria group bacterium]MDE2226896.1 hypothetical protein [Patescibacteria group bacterium]